MKRRVLGMLILFCLAIVPAISSASDFEAYRLLNAGHFAAMTFPYTVTFKDKTGALITGTTFWAGSLLITTEKQGPEPKTPPQSFYSDPEVVSCTTDANGKCTFQMKRSPLRIGQSENGVKEALPPKHPSNSTDAPPQNEIVPFPPPSLQIGDVPGNVVQFQLYVAPPQNQGTPPKQGGPGLNNSTRPKNP